MTYRYDLQVHTDASPCSRASPQGIVTAAVDAGLNGVVITDHDTMANVQETQRIAPPTLDVIPGVEVSTKHGDLLAIDVDELPTGSDIPSVIDDIHAHGGFAVPAHPFDTLRANWGTQLPELVDAIDAVETTNSRCVRQAFNTRAAEFAERFRIPATGGSDAHFPFEVGRAYTRTDRPLREALDRGETTAVGRGRYLSGHVATKLASHLLVR